MKSQVFVREITVILKVAINVEVPAESKLHQYILEAVSYLK